MQKNIWTKEDDNQFQKGAEKFVKWHMIQKGFKILQMASSNPKLTKDEKKELALLVAGGRISARTAERAVGLRGDGSSLL